MGHGADYDGIEEYDNPLPDWWVGLFLFTILWGVGYWVEYHFISGRSQEGSYIAQLEEAKQRWPVKVAQVSADPAIVAEGETLYQQNCASCHMPDLSGKIGPNLTDKVWVHDGTADGVIATVTNGVTAKGMPAWGPLLGPDKITKIVSFVASKGGLLAPGEKAAEAAPAAAVEVQVASMDPSEITPELLAQGEAVYAQNCAACHKDDLTGMVGPNLLDNQWIHGGALQDIVRTVTVGVPEKGMLTWGPILGEEKVKQVSGYIYSKSQGAP
jgi:cytochrome c oxidase cbb3-type subunit 3